MAALYDRFLEPAEQACLRDWRRELLVGVNGAVLEVGAGTGASVPLYSDRVHRLVLSEPDPHMRARLRAKLAPIPPHVQISDASLDALPFDDGSFDAVVSMLVLCSVADLTRSLREVHRVLTTGGRLVFLEHVAAVDRPGRLRWQRRLEPVWRRLAGNCHLTRRTEEAICACGLELEAVQRESIRRALPVTRPSIRGVARKNERGQEEASSE